MISGLSSSGIASAIRTAGKARATMDTMTRQIATGQRVSSVKDDGASWARANGARIEAQSASTLSQQLGRLQAGVELAVATGEAKLASVSDMRSIALQAVDPGLSSATRSALQNAYWNAASAYFNDAGFSQHAGSLELKNVAGTNWAPFAPGASGADLEWISSTSGGTNAVAFAGAIPSPLGSIASLAQAQAALTQVTTIIEPEMFARVAALANLGDRVSADRGRLDQTASRLESLVGSLTDADLGKAAAARAQAETRQQLALSTVRQAISAYGNFAGGLLGNVQQTQRGLLA